MTKEKGDYEVTYEKPIVGIVTARKCEHCGHHEIGITTEEGRYIALKPGMLVEIKGEEAARSHGSHREP
jgi:hypothetical protein